MTIKDDGNIRSFDTGATRDTGEGKLDYEGFLSPTVLRQYARFMNMNRLQSDGKLRDSDNWQKGIDMDVYMKSGFRHFFEWWEAHRDVVHSNRIDKVAAICGLMFNCMGYLHEWLKDNNEVRFDADEPTKEMAERKRKINRDECEKSATEFLEVVKKPVDYSNYIAPVFQALPCEWDLFHTLPLERARLAQEEQETVQPGEIPLPPTFPTLKDALSAIINDVGEISGLKVIVNPDERDCLGVPTDDDADTGRIFGFAMPTDDMIQEEADDWADNGFDDSEEDCDPSCERCRFDHRDGYDHPCDCCDDDGSNFSEKD